MGVQEELAVLGKKLEALTVEIGIVRAELDKEKSVRAAVYSFMQKLSKKLGIEGGG